MKKIAALLLALVFVLAAVACSNTSTPAAPAATGDAAPAAAEGYEIAMITDVGTIDDKSFNQGTWEGVVAYAEANNKTHKYYQPTEQSNDAYLAAIQLAVEGGAKVVVTPGYLFEEPIYAAQDMYPDVSFILIDGNPHDADYNYKTNTNTVGIVYAEEQSGFLAGYAAVKDGYTKLGFMGGMAVPAVVRYGYGFVQGAEAAAAEMGVTDLSIMYHYTGAFAASPEAQTLASSWYTSGTQVIFGCGGAVGFSVFAAAAENNGKAIGVDVDQSGESATVITSAMKGLSASVVEVLGQYYAGQFPGGKGLNMDAAHSGVQLPMSTSKFATFTQADYDAIFQKLVNGEVSILTDTVGTELENVLNLGTTIAQITPVA